LTIVTDPNSLPSPALDQLALLIPMIIAMSVPAPKAFEHKVSITIRTTGGIAPFKCAPVP